MYRQSVVLGALLVSSCVTYVADDADVQTVAAEVATRDGGRFTFDRAVAAALDQNPELRALTARARAAGADLAPFDVLGQYRSHVDTLAVMVDPIALLDLGPRGAANELLDREAAAAVVELANRRWRVAAELAEVFAVEAVLTGLEPPAVEVDTDAFERAGLASVVDAAIVRAARSAAAAERATIAAERDRNRARFRRLLALPDAAEVTLVPSPNGTSAPHTDAALLTRPDLALALARFRVADGAFRTAVAAQYPTFAIGPEIPLNGNPLEWMATLRLPVGGWGRADAARERREAARAELEAAYLRAAEEATAADLTAAAADADAVAARADLAA
ncbi:MAG: hypothetical protein KDE27_08020, partial [Planctomycetes bacterium]|nr:hypothetical protein [Planctomycetota bacterium]